MDYKIISERYPKAFSDLEDWSLGSKFTPEEKQQLFANSLKFHVESRRLYDFFDERNLNVQIIPEYHVNEKRWIWKIIWLKKPENRVFPVENWTDFTNSIGIENEGALERVDAEKSAFEKAFELHERSLNGEDIDKLNS